MKAQKNIPVKKLITALFELSKKDKAPIWARVAEELLRPTRQQRAVNLDRIESYAIAEKIILVPGKVLSYGTLTKKLTIVAHAFSAGALTKIKANGGTAVSIEEYIAKKPSSKSIQLLG